MRVSSLMLESLPLTILETVEVETPAMRAMSLMFMSPLLPVFLCISVQGRSVLFLATSPLWAVRSGLLDPRPAVLTLTLASYNLISRKHFRKMIS